MNFFEDEQKLKKYLQPLVNIIKRNTEKIYEEIAYWHPGVKMKTYTVLHPHGLKEWFTNADNDVMVSTKLTAEEIEVTDGYHTMSDLYAHRNKLFIALCKQLDRQTPLGSVHRVIKSRLHYDGTMFEGNFIVMIETLKLYHGKEQISYHLPLELWNECPFMELPTAWEWDGHTSDDVLERLSKL